MTAKSPVPKPLALFVTELNPTLLLTLHAGPAICGAVAMEESAAQAASTSPAAGRAALLGMRKFTFILLMVGNWPGVVHPDASR